MYVCSQIYTEINTKNQSFYLGFETIIYNYNYFILLENKI